MKKLIWPERYNPFWGIGGIGRVPQIMKNMGFTIQGGTKIKMNTSL